MHAQFADWYRQATLERDDGFLKKRWKLVETSVKELTPPGTLELVRLHLGLPGYDRSLLERLFVAVKDPGPSYAQPETTLELRILAGAGLVCLLEQDRAGPQDGHLAILAALAILCLRMLDVKMPAGPERSMLDGLANQLLTRLGEAYRQHSIPKISFPDNLPELPAINIEVEEYRLMQAEVKTDRYNNRQEHQSPIVLEIPSVLSLNEWNANANETLQSYWTTLTKTLQSSLEQYASVIPQMHAALHEENNILWWLFGEASNDLYLPLADLDPAARCLVVGKELADLIQVIPGPRAAPAFLDRALHSGAAAVPKEVALADAVASLTADWRQRAAAIFPPQLAKLCPVHQALRGSGTAAADTSADFPADWAPLDLAHQMYREQLLARLFAGLTKVRAV